jgi:hypothetical protein
MTTAIKPFDLWTKYGKACDDFRAANPSRVIRADDDDAKAFQRAFNAGARGYGEGWPYPLGPATDLLWFRQRGHVAASELDNG